MSIEHRPYSQEIKEDQKESRENLPSEINIYVVEEIKTQTDHVTGQDFGYGTPLKTPQKETYYVWKGKLQPTEYERQNPQSRENYARSSNGKARLEELAENFASNYRQCQNPDLQKKDGSSYSLIFEPSEETIKKLKVQHGDNAIIRGLNSEEQKRFMEAFRKANEEATKKK